MLAQRDRKIDIIERLHRILPQIEVNKAVAQHLRQRPEHHLRIAAPSRRLRRCIDQPPLRPILTVQHEAAKIMLLMQRVTEPRGRRGHTPPGRAVIAGRHPVIILKLEHIEGGARPAQRHVRALHFQGRRIERAGQIDEQQSLRPRRFIDHRRRQRRRRTRQQGPRRVEQRGLCAGQRAPHIRNRNRASPESRHRRVIVKAWPPVSHDPPPRLANLKPDHRPRIPCDRHECPRHRLQIGHRIAIGGREQRRWRHPSGQRGRSILCPLLPVLRAMFVEQFVGKRQDDLIAKRIGQAHEILMPRRARRIQRPAPRRRQERALTSVPAKPEIMAHPDIMVDQPATAELHDVAQQSRGRQIIAVVKTARDAQAMLRHHHIADRQRRSPALADNVAQFRPPLGGYAKRRLVILDIARRRERDEHPVDVARPHRIGFVG